MAILVSAPLAMSFAKKYNIAPKRVASLLDISACCFQSFIPHGGQIMLGMSMTGLAPVTLIAASYYPALLALATINHEVASRQMRDFGGMISIEVKGGKAAGMRLVNSLKMAVIAVSLGDAETLVQHPASMTHSAYSAEELKEAGIPEGLVRISVGLEDSEDIIADFRQAFAQV